MNFTKIKDYLEKFSEISNKNFIEDLTLIKSNKKSIVNTVLRNLSIVKLGLLNIKV